jgi:hypothetical protein
LEPLSSPASNPLEAKPADLRAQASLPKNEVLRNAPDIIYEEGDSEVEDEDLEEGEDMVDEVQSEHQPEEPDPFQQVLDVLDFEALASAALGIRKDPIVSLTEPHGDEQYTLSDALACAIDPEPVAGSYNIVYFINFSDGVKWIARIPGKGTSFDELDARKMNSEYNTMKYIQSKTTIPVSDIFHWDVSQGEVGAPYALMSFVEGSALSARWFDESWGTEEKRLKVLSAIAAAISQLQCMPFDKIGALEFDNTKKAPNVGAHFSARGRHERFLGAALHEWALDLHIEVSFGGLGYAR